MFTTIVVYVDGGSGHKAACRALLDSADWNCFITWNCTNDETEEGENKCFCQGTEWKYKWGKHECMTHYFEYKKTSSKLYSFLLF